MEFRVLGPLEVDDDGRQVALGGPKPRALLAILLLRRGEVVPAERLVELLYEGLPPEKAMNSVHVHVSRLRKALGDGRLRTAGGGYALEVLPQELDLVRFEQLVGRGRDALAAGDPEAAVASFREALEPYVPARVALEDPTRLGLLPEPFGPVLPDRLQHPVASLREAKEALLDE